MVRIIIKSLLTEHVVVVSLSLPLNRAAGLWSWGWKAPPTSDRLTFSLFWCDAQAAAAAYLLPWYWCDDVTISRGSRNNKMFHCAEYAGREGRWMWGRRSSFWMAESRAGVPCQPAAEREMGTEKRIRTGAREQERIIFGGQRSTCSVPETVVGAASFSLWRRYAAFQSLLNPSVCTTL